MFHAGNRATGNCHVTSMSVCGHVTKVTVSPPEPIWLRTNLVKPVVSSAPRPVWCPEQHVVTRAGCRVMVRHLVPKDDARPWLQPFLVLNLFSDETTFENLNM